MTRCASYAMNVGKFVSDLKNLKTEIHHAMIKFSNEQTNAAPAQYSAELMSELKEKETHVMIVHDAYFNRISDEQFFSFLEYRCIGFGVVLSQLSTEIRELHASIEVTNKEAYGNKDDLNHQMETKTIKILGLIDELDWFCDLVMEYKMHVKGQQQAVSKCLSNTVNTLKEILERIEEMNTEFKAQ